MESESQSLMVRGKKEPPRYCVLVVMMLSCWHWVGAALARGGVGGRWRDYCLVFSDDWWGTGLVHCRCLYITPRRQVFLRCSGDGNPSESSMRFIYTRSVVVSVQRDRADQSASESAGRPSQCSSGPVWVPYWLWNIFKYGSEKGLVCSVLYGTGANLQIIAPQKNGQMSC